LLYGDAMTLRSTTPPRFWSELSTVDFGALDPARAIAVLPIAAIEQHGPHLPVGVDAMILDGVVARAAALTPPDLAPLFLPAQSLGVSTEHRDFSGTLTLSFDTATRMLADIADSVARAGLRKLVLLNSHGGNSALLTQAALEARARCGLLCVTASLARFGCPDGMFDADELRHGIHGGAVETSLMLALRPDLVDMAKARDFASRSRDFERDFKWLRADRPAGFGWMAQDLSPDGAMGDAGAATREKGEAVAARWAEAIVELLDDVAAFDLSALRTPPTR